MRGFSRGWLVASAILCASGAARAAETKLSFPPCTTAPTDADRKGAQGAFLAGQGSFNEGDYATAITYWRDAYRRDCTAHLLLVNLARAYELKGDRAEAVAALETYLERKPDASDADQIRRRIDNLKSQIASAAPSAPTAAPEPAPTASPTPAPPPPAETKPSSGGKSRSAVPLFVAAAGGVAAISGLAVIGGGAGKVADAEKACPDRQKCSQETADLGNQGRAQEKTGGVLLGAGLVVGVGGMIWYLVQGSPNQTSALPSGATRKHADIIPAVGAGFAGIAVKGDF